MVKTINNSQIQSKCDTGIPQCDALSTNALIPYHHTGGMLNDYPMSGRSWDFVCKNYVLRADCLDILPFCLLWFEGCLYSFFIWKFYFCEVNVAWNRILKQTSNFGLFVSLSFWAEKNSKMETTEIEPLECVTPLR